MQTLLLSIVLTCHSVPTPIFVLCNGGHMAQTRAKGEKPKPDTRREKKIERVSYIHTQLRVSEMSGP